MEDVRPAREADASAICRIYNQGIEDRLATLETELRTPEERRQWLKTRDARHPVIVAEGVVACEVPEAVFCPFSTSMAGSAPENAMMPPAAPVLLGENVQL